jgi:hypothetical protein
MPKLSGSRSIIRKFILLELALTIIFQGCVRIPELPDKTPTSATTLSDGVSTEAITPTKLSTFTTIGTLTATSTPTRTSTVTLVPTQTIPQFCLSELSAVPEEDKVNQGKIMLLGVDISHSGQIVYKGLYFYYFSSRQSTLISSEGYPNVAISPDGKKYAVASNDNPVVTIYSNNSVLLGMVEPGQYPYTLDHWPDNRNLLLVISISQPVDGTSFMKYPNDEVMVDIATGEKTTLASNYPDLDQGQSRMTWEGISTTKYDPTLTLVVYPASVGSNSQGEIQGYVLYDRINKVRIAQKAVGQFSTTPVWSPDGSKFVINDTFGDGEFYVVTRDGVISKVSHLNGDMNMINNLQGNIRSSERYSWSPDGRYLAFWLETIGPARVEATFAVLDTYTGKTIDYCLSAGHTISDYGAGQLSALYKPYWSSDGKSILTIANRQDNGNFDTVLIDLEGGYAAKIAENLAPKGWLDNVGK